MEQHAPCAIIARTNNQQVEQFAQAIEEIVYWALASNMHPRE